MAEVNPQVPEQNVQTPPEGIVVQEPQVSSTPQDNTIAGMIPLEADLPESESSITFDDESPVYGDDQITFNDTEPSKPGLNLELAKEKAAKMHFALGEKSPGVDVLTNIFSTGIEDGLRQRLSIEETQEQEALRIKLIQEKAAKGETINPEDIRALTGLAQYIPKPSPETILERRYANQLISSAQSLNGGASSPISQGFRQNPEGTAEASDVAEKLIARQEILKNALHEVESVYQNQSWGGWTVDLAKSFVPLYGNVKLGWGEKRSDSYLRGNIVEDMVKHFWSMPLDQMPAELSKYLMGIAKDNPSLAREVASALLQHTSSSQFLDNAFTVIDVASITPVGRIARGAKVFSEAVTGARATEVTGATLKSTSDLPRAVTNNPAIEGLKGAVRGNASESVDLGRTLEIMGDTTRASEVRAGSRAAEILGNADASGQARHLINSIPDVFHPEKIVTNAPEGLASARSLRLVEHLKAHSERIAASITDLVKVGRAPEEAYMQAVQRESKALQESVLHGGATNDAILSVSWVLPEQTLNNVASISVTLGKTDGSTFNSFVEAMQYASQRYGLVIPRHDIRQIGQGFVIDVRKTIDETSNTFRETIKTSNNTQKPSVFDTMLGWARSADDRVPEFQRQNRKTAVHSHSALEKVFKDMISDIGSMKPKDREEVFRVMKSDKMEVDPGWVAKYAGEEPPRGRFRDTEEDFSVAFARANGGAFPSEEQTKAYFTYRQLNDWDWVLRNVGVYRDRARQGYNTIVLKDQVFIPDTSSIKNQTTQFIGKVVDEIPFNSDFDASLVIHTAGSEPTRMSMHTARSSPEFLEHLTSLKEQGYRIVKVENPTRVPLEERFGKDTVNFIITKDLEVAPLEFKQVPYRPGWHTEYAQPFFVKQAKGRSAGIGEATPRWIYEGDTSVFGFNTKAEATKYASRMEEARKLLKSGSDNLEEYLQNNLPWTKKEFEGLFKERPQSNGIVLDPLLDIDSPFLQVESGRYLTDTHGDTLRKSFSNFQDTIRSPHNDFANVDKKFLGQRDNPLWTVNELGSELKPILSMADEIDPGLSMNRTMANIMRTRTFTDYKISHVEGWIAQFSHLLDDNIELIRANPTHYIHEPKFVRTTADNAAEIQAAKNSRRALVELLGTESDLELRLQSYTNRVMDSIYNLGGQARSDKVSKYSGNVVEKDPVKLLRASVFHTTIGMFNPYQLVQNAATMANAIAIAGPVNGFQGAAAILPMRWALRNENTLDKIARNMTSFGWKPEWFKESFQELKRSGKWIIEGEHTWKDDISGPNIFEGKVAKFLDSGLFFFKEGERATRLASWNAAYLEWRRANPTAIITDKVRRELIERSDLMGGNMTRASNSSWQQGILAIPAQFLSYHARLAEQMLGNRLTRAEKARVMGVNSALYGLPIGVFGASGFGALTGGMYPWHEKINEEMLKRGIKSDDNTQRLFLQGIVGLMGKVVAGEGTDISGKMGPGGASLLKSIWEDEKFTKIVFGASGSKAGSIWDTMDPIVKYLMSPFRSTTESFVIRPEDVLGIVKSFKTVDNALAVWYAHNYGKAYARNGQELDSVTTRQMLAQMFLGAGPEKISDAYAKQDILKKRSDTVKKIMDLVAKDADRMVIANLNGDTDTADLYRRRISIHVALGDFTIEERAKVFSELIKKHKDKVQTIDWNFIRNAPASQAGARLRAQ